MQDAIVAMLVEVSKIQPFMLWINRVQFAGRGTIEIVYELLKAEHTENIGIVLGMNAASAGIYAAGLGKCNGGIGQ